MTFSARRVHQLSLIRATAIALVWALVLAAALPATAQLHPRREFRTMNSGFYELSIQQNGHIDLRLISGQVVFDDAYPMVWLEGEDEPRPLAVRGRKSARVPVNDRLGEGHGMIFSYKDCEWTIKSYPAKPFFAVQARFINNRRQPVRVKALMPWCVGEPKKGSLSLGPNTDQTILLSGSQTNAEYPTSTGLSTNEATAQWHVAAFNPVTSQSLITGFLTGDTARTEILLARRETAPVLSFESFRAVCHYEPAIEVAPGDGLASEWLYIRIAEESPFEGLERFTRAVADIKQAEHKTSFLPHGWDSWSSDLGADISEAALLQSLDAVDTHLKRYGWTHFTVGEGWQRAEGDWEPDPQRFPNGMKWLADQIHERGMTAGLWLAPFSVRAGTPVAEQHPEWLAMPKESASGLEPDERILDITVPGAAAYLRELLNKVTSAWGFDAVIEGGSLGRLSLAASFHDATLTDAQVENAAMNIMREAVGPNRLLLAQGTQPFSLLNADVVPTGLPTAPSWRAVDNSHSGCVEAMAEVSLRFYSAPFLWTLDPGCVHFGRAATLARWGLDDAPKLTTEQKIAWLTAAALSGGVVTFGERPENLTEVEIGLLRRLLPVCRRPAVPIDLFEREDPRIWSLPITSRAGEWHLVGLFNWNEGAPATITVDFTRLGLNPRDYYTVYNFWRDKYHGIARGRLNVEVPPGSVRLLGLRPYLDRPMFLATDSHFSQGATDLREVQWDAQNKRLTVTFDGISETDYHPRVLVPESYEFKEVVSSTGPVSTAMDGRVLQMALHCAEAAPVTWHVQF